MRTLFCFLLFLMSLSILSAQEDIQQGGASYYANRFHGKRTSSGELYDKHAFTCAHRTLPFGTSLKVSRVDNGKSVVVRVNDRGPHSAGRVVDLSLAAAETIDLVIDGVTQVKVEVVQTNKLPVDEQKEVSPAVVKNPTPKDPEPNNTISPVTKSPSETEDKPGKSDGLSIPLPPLTKTKPIPDSFDVSSSDRIATADTAGSFFVQVGAYSARTGAATMGENLMQKGFLLYQIRESANTGTGKTIYRTWVGPYANRLDAEQVSASILSQTGIKSLVLEDKK